MSTPCLRYHASSPDTKKNVRDEKEHFVAHFDDAVRPSQHYRFGYVVHKTVVVLQVVPVADTQALVLWRKAGRHRNMYIGV